MLFRSVWPEAPRGMMTAAATAAPSMLWIAVKSSDAELTSGYDDTSRPHRGGTHPGHRVGPTLAPAGAHRQGLRTLFRGRALAGSRPGAGSLRELFGDANREHCHLRNTPSGWGSVRASERFACALLGQNGSAFRKKKPDMGLRGNAAPSSPARHRGEAPHLGLAEVPLAPAARKKRRTAPGTEEQDGTH